MDLSPYSTGSQAPPPYSTDPPAPPLNPMDSPTTPSDDLQLPFFAPDVQKGLKYGAAAKRQETELSDQVDQVMNKCLIFMIIVAFIMLVRECITKEIPEATQKKQTQYHFDRRISQKHATFDFWGDENITINGTEVVSPSGKTQYAVLLPLYHMLMRQSRPLDNGTKFYAEISIGGEFHQVKTVRDQRRCEGGKTLCLTLKTEHPIENPIFVDYMLIYYFDEIVRFNRTYNIGHWNKIQFPLPA